MSNSERYGKFSCRRLGTAAQVRVLAASTPVPRSCCVLTGVWGPRRSGSSFGSHRQPLRLLCVRAVVGTDGSVCDVKKHKSLLYIYIRSRWRDSGLARERHIGVSQAETPKGGWVGGTKQGPTSPRGECVLKKGDYRASLQRLRV